MLAATVLGTRSRSASSAPARAGPRGERADAGAAGDPRDRRRDLGAHHLQPARDPALVLDDRDRPHHVLDLLRDDRRARRAWPRSARRSSRRRWTWAPPAGRPCACPGPGALAVGPGRRPAGLRALVRRLRALVLHHRRGRAAAAGADLVGDPLRRLADDQRDRNADDGRVAHRDRAAILLPRLFGRKRERHQGPDGQEEG